MVNRSYVKGRSFEYRVRKHLEKEGWFVVRQAKSVFPDLIAIRKGQIMLVECKVNKYLSRKERTELMCLAEVTGAETFVAYREKRKIVFSKPPKPKTLLQSK